MSASEINSNLPIASASLSAFDPRLGDIGSDDRIAFGAAKTEQAEPGHQHDAGQGIELMLDAAHAFVVARKIVAVVRRELACPLARGGGEFLEFAIIQRHNTERPVLRCEWCHRT